MLLPEVMCASATRLDPFRYLAFHKPYGVLCQFTGEPPTLADFIPIPNVYPVGRLDRDSEGLLLLTSDGAFQYRVTDPRFGHERTYWVQVEGMVGEEALRRLRSGVQLRDGLTRPARARRLDPAPQLPPRDPPVRFRARIPTNWIELVLTEGKNRQVRRMTAAVGIPTLRLIRVAIGRLDLEDLAVGQWRELDKTDLLEVLYPRLHKQFAGLEKHLR
jgi:23S rRNA pseudouridine2457 synthase